MINFITQTNYIKAREISKKSFAYYEKFELKKISKNNEYTKTGVQVFNLSKNLSKEISKLFKNKNKYLKKKNFNKKNIEPFTSFNRMLFNKNRCFLDKTHNYYVPSQKGYIIIEKLSKFLINKIKKILDSNIFITQIKIEETKINAERIIKKAAQNYENQSNFMLHRDGYPTAFRKVLVYPHRVDADTGATKILLKNKKTLYTKSKKPGLCVLFEPGLLHQAYFPKKRTRPIIQITLMRIKKKYESSFKVSKVASNYPLINPFTENRKIIKLNNLIMKKFLNKN